MGKLCFEWRFVVAACLTAIAWRSPMVAAQQDSPPAEIADDDDSEDVPFDDDAEETPDESPAEPDLAAPDPKRESVPDAPPERETPPEVADAIGRLAAPSFSERQRAFEELAEMGPEKTLPALERAARSGDRETRARAIELIRRFEKVRSESVKQAARDALKRLGVAEPETERDAPDPFAGPAPPRPRIPFAQRVPQAPRFPNPPPMVRPPLPPNMPIAPGGPFRPRIEIRIAPPGIGPPGAGPRIIPIPRGGLPAPMIPPPGLGRPANPPEFRNSRIQISEVDGLRTILVEQDEVKIQATMKPDGSIEGEHTRPVDGELKTDRFAAKDKEELEEKFPEIAERLGQALGVLGGE